MWSYVLWPILKLNESNRNQRSHYILFVSIKYHLFTNMQICFHFCFWSFCSKCFIFSGGWFGLLRSFVSILCLCFFSSFLHHIDARRERMSSNSENEPALVFLARIVSTIFRVYNGIHLECLEEMHHRNARLIHELGHQIEMFLEFKLAWLRRENSLWGVGSTKIEHLISRIINNNNNNNNTIKL